MKIEAKGETISKLLTEGMFTIPNYQREYDWEEEQINELIKDIKETGKSDSYFIGHMVFEGSRNDVNFTVIDGQQRLTTITIMLCCIRDTFYARQEKNLGDGINDNFIFRKDVNNNISARLNNKMPYPVLQARVLNVPEYKNKQISPKKAGEIKILNSYNHIFALFDKFTNEELKELRDKILNLEVVSVVVEGVSNACTIFMTLNSTGKDLTPLDLVKSLIFSKYKAEPLINEPFDTWKKITTNINQNTKFLNNFYASRYQKVSDRKIFKEVEKTINDLKPNDEGAGAKEFLNQMLDDSSVFKLINEPTLSDWNKNEYEVFESIFAIIKQFKIQVANSFLIALIRDYNNHSITKKYCIKALNKMEQFHFINNAICSSRSSGMDTFYAKYAKLMYQAGKKYEKHSIINEICNTLSTKIESKAEFTANIDKKLYYSKSDEKQKELVKYVLNKLERKENRNSILVNTSIEHVYPETPSVLTLANSNLIKNIGNLVLLEEDINSRIGNKDYSIKRNYVLNNSKISTAKKLFEQHKVWTDKEICDRRDSLISELYQDIWL